MDDQHSPDADDLLRRALIDATAAVAMALKVDGLALAEELTVVFHGRKDLGTIQTYVANGGHGEGATLGARDLLRVPCDLDLAEARDRDEAEEAYAAQARALRDALVAADTVLAIWRGPLEEAAGGTVTVERSIDLAMPLAGAPADAGRAARARAPARRRARLRRAHAGRGPPAAGHRAAPSRTSPTSTRCPTTPSAASRTSSTARPSTRGGPPNGSSPPSAASSASWSSAATTSAEPASGRARARRPPPSAVASSPSSSRAVVVFVAISVALARFLLVREPERDELLDRPAGPGPLGTSTVCSTSSRTATRAARATSQGAQRDGPTRGSCDRPPRLRDGLHLFGTTRGLDPRGVESAASTGVPVVQCVRVRRDGRSADRTLR